MVSFSGQLVQFFAFAVTYLRMEPYLVRCQIRFMTFRKSSKHKWWKNRVSFTFSTLLFYLCVCWLVFFALWFTKKAYFCDFFFRSQSNNYFLWCIFFSNWKLNFFFLVQSGNTCGLGHHKKNTFHALISAIKIRVIHSLKFD